MVLQTGVGLTKPLEAPSCIINGAMQQAAFFTPPVLFTATCCESMKSFGEAVLLRHATLWMGHWDTSLVATC